MLIPFRTNRPSKRRPVATELLIYTNVFVFALMLVGEHLQWWTRDTFTAAGALGPDSHLLTYISYQFLHDPRGVMHLGGNMLFLWVFGSAVEGRLGRVVFVVFYLIGGIVAGFGHSILSEASLIGASGSICAVTGAFAALFPRSRVDVFVFFFFVGILSVKATIIIGIFVAFDLLGATFSHSNVAYTAHLAGYAYGFGIGFALLAFSVLPREEFDIFFLYTQWRRRQAFRRASVKQVGGLYESASADTGARLEKTRRKARADDLEDRHAAQRSLIASHLGAGDLEEATTAYLELLKDEPEACLGEAQQADIANHLAHQHRDREAALAYEQLVRRFPNRNGADEVRLMLAVLYARRLDRPDDARRHLGDLGRNLRDVSQRELAHELKEELGMDPAS